MRSYKYRNKINKKFSSTNWFVLQSYPCSVQEVPCFWLVSVGPGGLGMGSGGTLRTAASAWGSMRAPFVGRMA